MIDSHAHLDMNVFDSDRDQVIDRAFSHEVKKIITIGIDLESSVRAVALAERYPSVFASAGIHPHNADKSDRDHLEQIGSLAAHDKVVAIGEIGLDFYRNRSSRNKQIERFKEQLDLAFSCDLPVIIHARDAFEEVMKILSLFPRPGSKGVIHCFSGDCSLAKAFIAMGFYISIPGTVTFRKAHQMHDVAASVPLNRILIETDAPFLAPVPHRGGRNEPCFVVHSAQKIAELRGISIDEVAKRTSENTCELFNLISSK